MVLKNADKDLRGQAGKLFLYFPLLYWCSYNIAKGPGPVRHVYSERGPSDAKDGDVNEYAVPEALRVMV